MMAISGVVQAASMDFPSRRARYSGRDRPAWRMNHTGVVAGLIPFSAARIREPENSGSRPIETAAKIQS